MKLLFEHQNYFHPSIAAYQGKLILVMHRQLAMDHYTPPLYSISENDGEDWSEPQVIPTLKDCGKCADFRPLTLPEGSPAAFIGLVQDGKSYKTVYLFFDGEWSEPQEISGVAKSSERAACMQSAIAPDGSLIIPFYYLDGSMNFSSVTRKYRLEGKKLIHLESGDPLVSTAGRGWYEPSVTFYCGKYYLTLRCDENCAMVARSDDGLHWSKPEKWHFADGSLLETGPTQQHWMKKNGELWLVYTRHDVSNEDCFRWRTPMFAAPFDPEAMCLDQSKETILIPRIDYRERPGLLGNFNVANFPDCVYISDAPLWFDWTADRNAIAWFNTSVAIRKITF